MKGKVTIVFAISEHGNEAQITSRALVRRAGSVMKKNSTNNALTARPKYDIKRVDTVQYILALHKKLNELDNSDKNVTKVRIDNLDAEFISTKSHTTGMPYDAVIVNLGTKEEPIMRRYYLSSNQSKLIRMAEFKPEYDFTFVENLIDEEAEEDSEDAE